MPLRLATFNVKDLLDRTKLPSPPAHLAEKLAWTAAKIATVDADVLALQEVGSRAIVNELLAGLERRGGYDAVVMGTPDKRGIGCALVSRRPISWSTVHTAETLDFPVFRAGDPPPFAGRIPLRRGVVHARVDGHGLGAIDVFVGHFKSRRPVPLRTQEGDDIAQTGGRANAEAMLRSLVQRAAEALYVRGLVDARLAEDSHASIAVMGDLNDVAESATLAVLRGEGPDHPLVSAARLVAGDLRYSVMHAGERSQIDHVLLTENLAQHQTAARFFHDGLRDHGDEEWTVDSDHAPFAVDLSDGK